MISRTKMLVRVYKTISSCKTAAQLECAIKYKDVVLDFLYGAYPQQRKNWDERCMRKLNAKALEITGLLEDD